MELVSVLSRGAQRLLFVSVLAFVASPICAAESKPSRPLLCFSAGLPPALPAPSCIPAPPLDATTSFRALTSATRLQTGRGGGTMLQRLQAQRGQQRFAGTFKLSWPSLESSPSVPLGSASYTSEQEALLDCRITRLFMHTLPLRMPHLLEPLAELGASIPIVGASVRHTILILEVATPQGPQPRTVDKNDEIRGRAYVSIDFVPVGLMDPAVTARILAGVGADASVRVRFLQGCPRPPRGCVLLGDARPGFKLRDAVEYGEGWDGTRLNLVSRDCKVFATELAEHLS